MRFLAAAAAGVACAWAQSAPALPTWPTQYAATGTFVLPYANMSEPFAVYTDASGAGLQTIQYYGGLTQYVYRGDINVTWQVNPVVTTEVCSQFNGSISLTSYLPALNSNYTYLGRQMANGVLCDWWEYEFEYLGRVSTYDLFVKAGTSIPVQFHMLGRNIVTGSHYDEYAVNFATYQAGPSALPGGIFNQPAGMTCGAFPAADGGAAEVVEGNALAAQLIPQPGAPHTATHATDPAFAAWMARHGKAYATDAEAAQRYANYLHAHRSVTAGNHAARARGSTMRLALNFQADFTPAEWALRRGKRSDGSSRKADAVATGRWAAGNGAGAVHAVPTPAEVAALPASVDWRVQGAMEPVQDQAFCGSCWSFGSTASIAGIYYLKYGAMNVFSKQELVDCSWPQGNDACDGGEDFLGYQWIMSNGGLATRAAYSPYLGQDGFCRANVTQPTVKVTGYVNVTSGSEQALMSAVATVGPISISIDASLDTFGYFTTGVYDDPNCSNQMADQDHTIVLAGYGTDPVSGLDYWIARNSWSTHWGDNGYILIARAGNICGVTLSPTYVTIQ